jgi:predicted alpha/beta-fold hydrolase
MSNGGHLCWWILTSPSGAGMPITSGRLYTAGGTDDVRQALMYLSKCFPDAPLLGIGYSLGANIMTRYAAEEGENCRLAAACVMANVGTSFTITNWTLSSSALPQPWDFAKNNVK